MIDFRKYLLRNRLKHLLKRYSGDIARVANREKCELLMREIPVEYFKQYNVKKGTERTIQTGVKNLDAYVRLLKKAQAVIRTEQYFSGVWYTDSLTEYESNGSAPAAYVVEAITIDRLLVSANGYYSDPYTVISEFQSVGHQICLLLRQADAQQVGYYETTVRMLNKLFLDMAIIAIGLIQVYLDD